MIKLDHLALAAAGAYIGVKLLASTSKSEFVRKASLRFADAIVAAQIYIVVTKIREDRAALVVEVPVPATQVSVEVAATQAVSKTASTT